MAYYSYNLIPPNAAIPFGGTTSTSSDNLMALAPRPIPTNFVGALVTVSLTGDPPIPAELGNNVTFKWSLGTGAVIEYDDGPMDVEQTDTHLSFYSNVWQTLNSYEAHPGLNLSIACGITGLGRANWQVVACQVICWQAGDTPPSLTPSTPSTEEADTLDFWDIWAYRYDPAAARDSAGDTGRWQRITFPPSVVSSFDYEIIERGGFGDGHIKLLVPYEDYQLVGNERMDIYRHGTLVYRGYVRLPETDLEVAESKVIQLTGVVGKCTDWLVKGRYAFGSLVDASQVATALFNDVAVPRWANILSDIQTVGITLNMFDAAGKKLTTAMNQLLDLCANQAIWGWDVALDSDGLYKDRFYLRPRATTVKQTFVIGDDVKSVTFPSDYSNIVNRIHITGRNASQPNLVNNGGFEYPIPPDENHGNSLGDGGFEFSQWVYDHGVFGIVTGGHTVPSPYWTLLNNASIRDRVHLPVTGEIAPRTDRFAVTLDQNNEEVQQTVSFDRSRVAMASCWACRGYSLTAATMSFVVELLDASNTLVTTVAYSASPVDPGVPADVPGSGDPTQYSQLAMTVDARSFPTVAKARIRIWSHSGTNLDDGIVVDDVGLWYEDQVAQSGWIDNEYHMSSYTVDWAHKISSAGDSTPPHNGAYCVKVLSLRSDSTGYVEIRNQKWARIKFPAAKPTSVGVCYKSGASAVSVIIGVTAYDSGDNVIYDAHSTAVPTSDGLWHSTYFTLNGGLADTEGDVYIRVLSDGVCYLDDIMVVTGPIPGEFADQTDVNWWEGSSYERTFGTDSSLLSLPAGISDVAGAHGSQYNYGVRDDEISQPLVWDKASAILFANSYFVSVAQPKLSPRMVVSATDRQIALDGRIRLIGLPVPVTDQPLIPSRVQYSFDTSVTMTVDLNNERPTLASVLHDQVARATQGALQTASAQTASASSAGPNTGASGLGGVTDSNLVHLTGDAELISSAKIFKPASDIVVLGLQREAAGQASSFAEWYDETGALLGKIMPAGGVQSPDFVASGLTGAVAGSRWVGATGGGAPTTGTFAIGDFVIDRTGAVWICTVAGTPGTWTQAGGGLANPMTTQDDIIIAGAAGVPTRLAKGSGGQVLTVDGTTNHLAWETPASGGMANPMTTADDIIIGGAAGLPTRLAKGSSGQVLTVNSSTGDLDWETPSAGFVNPMTTAGDLIVGGAAGAASRLGLGTNGQVLVVRDGIATWIAASLSRPVLLFRAKYGLLNTSSSSPANGNSLASWADQTSVGYNAGASANYPTYDSATPSVAFSGSQYMTYNTLNLPFGSLARTVSGWIKVASGYQPASGHLMDLFSYGPTGITNQLFLLYMQNGNNGLFLTQYGASVGTSSAVNTGAFVHFAFTIDSSGNVVAYINGAQTATGTLTLATTASAGNIGYIGWGADAGDKWSGNIAEIRVDDFALKATQVAALNAMGVP